MKNKLLYFLIAGFLLISYLINGIYYFGTKLNERWFWADKTGLSFEEVMNGSSKMAHNRELLRNFMSFSRPLYFIAAMLLAVAAGLLLSRILRFYLLGTVLFLLPAVLFRGCYLPHSYLDAIFYLIPFNLAYLLALLLMTVKKRLWDKAPSRKLKIVICFAVWILLAASEVLLSYYYNVRTSALVFSILSKLFALLVTIMLADLSKPSLKGQLIGFLICLISLLTVTTIRRLVSSLNTDGLTFVFYSLPVFSLLYWYPYLLLYPALSTVKISAARHAARTDQIENSIWMRP